MSAMIHALAHWLEPLMLVAMVAVFTLTIVNLYWPGRRATVEQPGRIPLEDDR